MLSKDDQIVEGDHVSVYWENVQAIFNAEVLAAPSGPGEIWILKEINVYKNGVLVRSGQVHYVMSFSRMTKHSAPIAKQSYHQPPE